MKHYDIAEQPCPTCGYVTECASDPFGNGSKGPKAGDINLCMKCGEVMVFNEDLTSRLATLDDMLEMGPEGQARMELVQRKIRAERPVK